VTTDWRDTRIAELEAELSAKDVELSSRDARIAELEQRVAALAKQVAELVEKLGRDSRNSHLPPSSDPPGSHAGKGKKSGRKRGGQPGHGGVTRKLLPPEEVDEVINLFPRECESCWTALPEVLDPSAKRYQQTELLPPVRRHTKEWRCHEVACPKCRYRTRARYDATVIPASPFGPRLMATSAALTGDYHLSRRKTVRLLLELLGVRMSVGALIAVESGAQIAAGVTVGPHCVVGARSSIGEGGWLASRVTLYHDVQIGKRVVIQSGAVIGGEGFGFANEKGVWQKIAQIGGVSIGDDVEIGANTTIDRGALADTLIGNGVKLDNQIMIAHNVQIGDNTAMAGCAGISGSTKIGKNCMIAGGVGMVGHIEVCDNVFVTGMTMVTRSITEPGSYSSGTAMQPAAEWRKSAARIRQLDDMARRLQQMEKQLAAVTSGADSSSDA
jgi:UDP-3-O-[3-hydroxymyristoyl] glucosamine N-acyltransferase LpxD